MKSAENDPAGHTIIMEWMGGELAGLHSAPHLGRMSRPNRQCLQSITSSRERWYFVLRLFWIHESDIQEPTAGKAIELKTDLCKA